MGLAVPKSQIIQQHVLLISQEESLSKDQYSLESFDKIF